MSMLDYFFSVSHAGSVLFEKLSIWKKIRTYGSAFEGKRVLIR